MSDTIIDHLWLLEEYMKDERQDYPAEVMHRARKEIEMLQSALQDVRDQVIGMTRSDIQDVVDNVCRIVDDALDEEAT